MSASPGSAMPVYFSPCNTQPCCHPRRHRQQCPCLTEVILALPPHQLEASHLQQTSSGLTCEFNASDDYCFRFRRECEYPCERALRRCLDEHDISKKFTQLLVWPQGPHALLPTRSTTVVSCMRSGSMMEASHASHTGATQASLATPPPPIHSPTRVRAIAHPYQQHCRPLQSV